MGYIGFGLLGIIVGSLLALGGDSPSTWEASERLGFLLLVVGGIAVLVGIVVQVVSVNRAERRRL